MKTSKIRYLYSYVFFVLWTFLFIILNDYNGKTIGQITSVLLITNFITLIYRAAKVRNTLLLIIFVFMALYMWPAKLFFYDNLFFSAHNREYTFYSATYLSLLFLLFTIVLNHFTKFSSPDKYKKIQFQKNNLVYWGVYIVAFLILIVFKRSGSHYDGSGEDVQVSSLYEYDLILFLIIYIYTNNEKFKLKLFYFLCILYAFFTIIVGGRIEVILLGFLLLTIKFQHVISFRKMVFLLIIGIWGMSVFVTIRQNPSIIFTSDVIDILNPFVEKERIIDYQISNEGDVYWASERMIILIQEGVISFTDRIQAAFCYLISPYVPISQLPPIANLANYKIDLYTTGGGGMVFAYYYVMFGILGILFFGYLFSLMLNLLYKKTHSLLLFYIILMITSYARWLVYNPVHLIKFCVWGTICFFFIRSLDYTLKKHYFKRITKKYDNNN